MNAPAIEDQLREYAPQVLAALTRRHDDFGLCEDAVQEALMAAATLWPAAGIPDNPRGWLLTVAARRLTDQVRADAARRRREQSAGLTAEAPAADAESGTSRDDSLILLFLCCHPALTVPSQIALTLRSVGGLSTAEIARSFLVPEATMAQRISRAKKMLAEAGARFRTPGPEELPGRLAAVLHVLYLIFNEGYTASSGPHLLTLNRAVALAIVRGPQAGLALLDSLDDDQRLATGHRLLAVRAHLLEMAGEHEAARTAYLAAARRTTSQPEKRYLERHAALLAGPGHS